MSRNAGRDLPRFWWSQLCAVPPQKSSRAYKRLERVWLDHTRPNTSFRDPRGEVHLVCTLFENMVLFNPDDWVTAMMTAASIGNPPRGVTECTWSYEFEDAANVRFTASGRQRRPPIADIVGHGRDAIGEFVFVIEAKRPGGAEKEDDRNPDYYLDSPTFSPFSRRYMLYLWDEAELAARQPPIEHDRQYRGALTWQQLGGLQIRLAQAADLPEPHRSFIAGAIQYQFCQHGLMPDSPAAEYLTQELPYDKLPISKHAPGAQQRPDRRKLLWHLDWEDEPRSSAGSDPPAKSDDGGAAA
ncbi:MAG: hypothetical protein AMXMBFR47_08310 [Planctomycetota bacterium]